MAREVAIGAHAGPTLAYAYAGKCFATQSAVEKESVRCTPWFYPRFQF